MLVSILLKLKVIYMRTYRSRTLKKCSYVSHCYSPHLFPQALLSYFTLHPCPIPDCEYPNDINRVVITLTAVTAEALLRGTVLTTLHLPKALTPTPINTYEYWQRPAISIITFQVCVSVSLKPWRLITFGNGRDLLCPPCLVPLFLLPPPSSFGRPIS